MNPVALGLAAVAMVLAIGSTLAWKTQSHVVAAGFWFDEQALVLDPDQERRLGGALTPDEGAAIARLAWSELNQAYEGFRIALSENRQARYQIRVVHHVDVHPLSPFRRRMFDPAGESRAMGRFGGAGSVSVRSIAGNAIAHAPAHADRPTILSGLARGIGRTAAHELAHLLLPTSPLHDSKDVSSYEYFSAGRAEQYYGALRWDLAGPLLTKRLGRRAAGG